MSEFAGGGEAADDHLRQARALLQLNRPAQAGRAASLAVADAPSDSHAWGLLSVCHSALGEHRRALDAINTAVVLDPSNPQWHLHASRVRRELDHKKASIQSAQEAVRLDPTDATAHAELAISHARRGSGQRILGIRGPGDVRSAERHARQAISLDPTSITGHFAAGYAAAAGGRRRAARKHYLTVLALEPHNVATQNNLAALDLGVLHLGRGGRGFAGVLRADPSYDKARLNILRTVYLQLALFGAVAWGVYLAFFIAVASAVASASAVAEPRYAVAVGGRTVLAIACSLAYVVLVVLLWRRSHAAVRAVARRLIASDRWLWVCAVVNAFVVGCFWVGAVGHGSAVANVYLAGVIALPIALLSFTASKSRVR